LLAILLLLGNDHLLKGSGLLPGWLTGKLSDLAGLFFFPILLVTLLDPLAPRWLRGRSLSLLCAAATGLVFAALKLSPALNALVAARWGSIVLDPTDLFALPALGLALLFLEARAPSAPAPRWFQVGGVLLAAVASLATSGPTYPRAYPRWEITRPTELSFPCARVWPFVARSGKEGVGLGMEVLGEGCEVRAEARMIVGASIIEGRSAPVQAELRPLHLYIPLPFDNNASWNRGERDGTLELLVIAGEERRAVRLPMHHRFDCFYEHRYRARPLAKPHFTPQRPGGTFATPPSEEQGETCPPEDTP
jgi:hypothetical protein